MEKFGYIYETMNKKSKRPYVGQHVGQFNPYYLGSGLHITRAIRKNGIHSFEVKILAWAGSKKELDALEIKYIAEYKKSFSGQLYNIHDGGTGFAKGKANPIHDPKVKKKHKKAVIAAMSCPEVRNKLVLAGKKKVGKLNPRWGKHCSKETKDKISEGNTGKRHSLQFKKSVSERFKGKPSHRKGKTLPLETCTKMSESHQGVSLSEFHKEKMRHPHKQYVKKDIAFWANKKQEVTK